MPKRAKISDVCTELGITTDATTMHKAARVTCIKCQTVYTCSLFNYRRRGVKCCEGDRPFLERAKRRTVNGRDTQVKFEKIKERIDEICLERNGTCVNPDSYVNNASLLTWSCNICTYTWTANLNNVYHKKSWCSGCSFRQSERKCRSIIEYISGHSFEKVRPDWLENLELDCYNADIGVALEYNGIQHYQVVPGWHRPDNYKELTDDEITAASQEKFMAQQERDRRKAELCAKMEIRLIVVSYLEMKKGIPEVKRTIVKYFPEFTDESWLATEDAAVTDNAASLERRSRMVALMRGRYILVDPNVVIHSTTHRVAMYCKSGHTFQYDIDSLVRGRGCPKCSKNFKWTISEVRDWIAEVDPQITLVSDVYVNVGTPIEYKCTCGNQTSQTLDNIKRSVRERGRICRNKIHCGSIMDKIERLEKKLLDMQIALQDIKKML